MDAEAPAKVQWMPEATVSSAVARAVFSAISGSKLAASPSGMGKTVHMPWMTSWRRTLTAPTAVELPRTPGQIQKVHSP